MFLKNQNITFRIEDQNAQRCFPISKEMEDLEYDDEAQSLVFQSRTMKIMPSDSTIFVLARDGKEFRIPMSPRQHGKFPGAALDIEDGAIKIYLRLTLFPRHKAAMTVILYTSPFRPDLNDVLQRWDRIEAEKRRKRTVCDDSTTSYNHEPDGLLQDFFSKGDSSPNR